MTRSPASRWSRRSGRNIGRAYLAAIARALKPGGRAAIQFIAIDDAIFEGYARNVDFIQRYVFPGGMLISESRFRAIAEQRGARSGRIATGFGLDYAETLRRWREDFDAAVAEGRLAGEFDGDFVELVALLSDVLRGRVSRAAGSTSRRSRWSRKA